MLLFISLLGYAMVIEAGVTDPPEGDWVRGKAVYEQCIGCHSPDRHRTGPRRCGLNGRKAGTAAGYEYSKAMQQTNVTWTAQALDHFLHAPLDFIPGTSMGITGIKKDNDRWDLIAYLIAINGQDECHLQERRDDVR